MKKYPDHTVCSYDYKLICVDGWYSKPYKIYYDEEAVDKFWNDLIKESEYYFKVIQTKFNKSLFVSEKCNEDFSNSAKCWICKKAYEKGETKVKDHDHVIRKYRGSLAHQELI